MSEPQTATARPSRALTGTARVPGDKSISHRALMLATLAVGESTIEGLLESADVLATAEAMRALGAVVARDRAGAWHVHGVGVGGLAEPEGPLDFGNSGTGARLCMGLVASHPVSARFEGDASLSRRPMGRVLEPLQMMGARVEAETPGHLPLTLHGARAPLPISYRVPVPSAQVKSAVLLAGLNTPGETTVIETRATRDHTERMLRLFGARLRTAEAADGAVSITVAGHAELSPRRLAVPADPSSAAFPMVAALIVPGSDIVLTGVLVNPLRTGLIETLREMGGAIELMDERAVDGEPVADIRVRAGPLRGVRVPAARAPSMIDEYPALAVAAAFAQGETVMEGLAELRLKESDRLAAIATGLGRCGVAARIDGDSLTVAGAEGVGGGEIASHGDHRIAMAFLTLGLAAAEPVIVDGAPMIDTSFPGFCQLMAGLGADISVP